MAKNLSRDQKRKAKLAERDKRSRELDVFTPYSGRKYQADCWTPVVFVTERAIYDVILESNRELTNSHVRRALELLIDHLRRGGPPGIGDGEEAIPFSAGHASECVFFNVRKAWLAIANHGRTVATTDLIGIARTLLHSIEARGHHTGQSRGYVAFLEEFMPQFIRDTAVATKSIPMDDITRIYHTTDEDVLNLR